MKEPPASSPPGEYPNALPVGARLSEFEIISVIGVGGFSIVYMVHDHALQCQRALKEYLPGQLAYRALNGQITLRQVKAGETYGIGLRSFVNEARMLAKFDHPALVRVLRFWEAHGTAYMVMPYYQGITLQDERNVRARPPDQAWIQSLTEPIISALAMLHAASVVHRDVSPDNILLQPNGQPILLDLGAARQVIAGRERKLTAILRPDISPIEQFGLTPGQEQGPWTDLYALASVVYFCMSGALPPPSVNRSVNDTMRTFRELAETLRTTHGLVYTRPFLDAWQHALAVMPSERTRSVEQLRLELAGRRSAPLGGLPHSASAGQRRRIVWAGGGLGLVALGGAAVALRQCSASPPPVPPVPPPVPPPPPTPSPAAPQLPTAPLLPSGPASSAVPASGPRKPPMTLTPPSPPPVPPSPPPPPQISPPAPVSLPPPAPRAPSPREICEVKKARVMLHKCMLDECKDNPSHKDCLDYFPDSQPGRRG
jgi:serine/threonine protein kinase